VLGAPKIGDKASWAPHIKMGLEHLTHNAIAGIKQMPPRGGDASLSDLEIARAIVYMANQSGASFKEPAAAPAGDKGKK
jgi:cytochrome c5